VQFEELRFTCQQAAKDHAAQASRPLAPAVILPGPEKTRIVRLPDFPDEDEDRHELMLDFAKDEVEKNLVPCWGFVAEASLDDQDVLIVVYGARRNAPTISAAPFLEGGELGEFMTDEPLDPKAMPFLHPLQHAVDAMATLAEQPTPLDAHLGRDSFGNEGGTNLPIIS
jgi:hypothetical protein